MTKMFNDCWQCPDCGNKYAKETLFKQWVRAHPGLESTNGFVVYDSDMIVHRYKIRNDRTFQLIMFVEIKTFGSLPDKAQQETLSIVSQMFRNRRKNKHNRLRAKQSGCLPNRVYSRLLGKEVSLRAFGFHLLTFEKNGPKDSEWIKWDDRIISEEQLVALLKFELDPDKLTPMDFRLHHKAKELPLLTAV